MLRIKFYEFLFNVFGIFVQRYIIYMRDGILMDRFTGEVFTWN